MKKYIKSIQIIGIILLIVVGLNAIIAGTIFIFYPDGSAIGLSNTILKYSPFEDFRIPGIILFLVNGVSSIAVAILTMRNNRYYPLLITCQGIIIILWLILQMIFLRQANTLQMVILCVGIVLIFIGGLISTEQINI